MSRRLESFDDRIRTAELNRHSALNDVGAEKTGRKGERWDKCTTYLPSLGVVATVGRRLLARSAVRTTVRVAETKLTFSTDSDQPGVVRIRNGKGPARTYVVRDGVVATKARGGAATISDRNPGIPALHRAIIETLPRLHAETNVYRRPPADASRRAADIHDKFEATIGRATSDLRAEVLGRASRHERTALNALTQRIAAHEELVAIRGVVAWAYKDFGTYKQLTIDRRSGVPDVQRRAAKLWEAARRAERVMVREGGRLYELATSGKSARLPERERADMFYRALRLLVSSDAGLRALGRKLHQIGQDAHHDAALGNALKNTLASSQIAVALGVAFNVSGTLTHGTEGFWNRMKGHPNPNVAKLLGPMKMAAGLATIIHESGNIRDPAAVLELGKGLGMAGSGLLGLKRALEDRAGRVDGRGAISGSLATIHKMHRNERETGFSILLKSASVFFELASVVSDRPLPVVGTLLSALAQFALYFGERMEEDAGKATAREHGYLRPER